MPNITINVSLDEQNVPEKIEWSASDSQFEKPQEIKAFTLSLFDKENRDTLKIDLWTKDMQVAEMDKFMFQTLRALGDMYYNATKNTQLASEMQQFVQYFGEKTEILVKNEEQ